VFGVAAKRQSERKMFISMKRIDTEKRYIADNRIVDCSMRALGQISVIERQTFQIFIESPWQFLQAMQSI
jgi:hypothetical protein